MERNEILDKFLEERKINLTDEQYRFCYDVIFGEGHVANWSVAGSGKSLCIEIIQEFLGDKCITTATTGAANSNLFNSKGGHGTAHSCLSLALGLHTEQHEKKISNKTRNLFGKSDLIRVVMIDEAGMLNPDSLCLINKRLNQYNRPYGKKRSKRNIKLVLIGDLLQLPPVITKEEEIEFILSEYDDTFLPRSSIYKEMGFKTHIFTQVLRTTDKTFQAALDVIRYGQSERYERCLAWLNRRFVKDIPDGIPIITTTNKKVDEMNERELANNPNPLHELRPVLRGTYDIRDCPIDPVVRLKVDSPVIVLVNDQEGRYHNGSFGHVVRVVHGEGVMVKLKLTDEDVFIPMFEYENREYFTDTKEETGEEFLNQRTIGTCLHYPLKLASAISVHRSQGKTLRTPYMLDLGMGFSPNQDHDWGMQLAYVGLSRASSVDNIYLSRPLTFKHIKCNLKARDWVLENLSK